MVIIKIIKVWTKYSALDDSQYAYLADRGTDSALLQVINAFDEADELNTSLLFASFDVKRAFDRPPKKILRLAWTRMCVPSDTMKWLIDLGYEGHGPAG